MKIIIPTNTRITTTNPTGSQGIVSVCPATTPVLFSPVSLETITMKKIKHIIYYINPEKECVLKEKQFV